jgi:hypothetical protein
MTPVNDDDLARYLRWSLDDVDQPAVTHIARALLQARPALAAGLRRERVRAGYARAIARGHTEAQARRAAAEAGYTSLRHAARIIADD